ncbi:hypothetical protein ABSL23_17385 (plasmid) [Halobacterium sp. NMX12-1]|uniref:Uncharacterized protein n=1 Tax=Halobacterium sp. NMX12-1 TaxID=3166650 RepID=A0AAU8CI88_9EURY
MNETAFRVRDGDEVLYLTPFTDGGRRVLYRQDPKTFETSRHTVGVQRARTLRESGREVPLAETPAWCDPRAPRDDSTLAQPS